MTLRRGRAGTSIEKDIDEQADIYAFLFHDLTEASAREQTRRRSDRPHGNAWRLCCNLCSWMIWFFDRDGEKLRYEISHDRTAGRYRVVITHPDGTESVEEVDEPTELIERSVELMNSLRGEGWKVA